MVGKTVVMKKYCLELTEAEMNTVALAVGSASPAHLLRSADEKGLNVLPDGTSNAELFKFYTTLKSLAGIE